MADSSAREPPPSGLTKLLSRIGGVAGATVVAQAITGVVYLVAARGLGPELFGRYATAIAIATIAVVAFDLGINNLLVREVAGGRIDLHDARATIKGKRPVALLLEVVVVGICWWVVRDLPVAIGIGSIAWAQWEAQTGNALLRAQESFRPAYLNQIIGRAASLAPAAAFLLLGQPHLVLATAPLFGFLVEAAMNRRALGSGSPARRPPLRRLLALHREASGFALLGVAASAQQLDTPLVAFGGGAVAAGIYAAASRLMGPLGFLGASLTSVAAPWLARAQRDPDVLLREERKVGKTTLLISLGPILAAVVGPWLLPVLLGAAYASSGATFAVLCLGAFFSAMNQGLAVVLQNRRAQLWVASSVAVGIGLGLVSTWLLAVLGGAVLAAFGYTVSQAVILTLLALRYVWLRTSPAHRGRHRKNAAAKPLTEGLSERSCADGDHVVEGDPVAVEERRSIERSL